MIATVRSSSGNARPAAATPGARTDGTVGNNANGVAAELDVAALHSDRLDVNSVQHESDDGRLA